MFNLLIGKIGKQVEALEIRHRDDDSEKILTWISPISFRSKQAAVLDGVQPGTGQWLLQDTAFLDWTRGEVSMLWCPGIRKKILTLFLRLNQRYTNARAQPAPVRQGLCEWLP